MTDRPSHRPRHIRDIAHLYLSRKRPPSGVRDVTGVPTSYLIHVSAQRRDLFPGFHVANIAAALSRRRIAVHIFEMSGVHPNSGYFFSHPPGIYLHASGHANGARLPALNGITLSFASSGERNPGSVEGRSVVNLVHGPPFGEAEPEQAPFSSGDPGQRWELLLVGADGASPVAGHGRTGSRTFVLEVEPVADGPSAPTPVRELGGLPGWRHSLCDRVPVVFRDPTSRLSLSYLSICDSLLGQIKVATNHDAERFKVQTSPSLG